MTDREPVSPLREAMRGDHVFGGDTVSLAGHLCRLLDSTGEGIYSIDLQGRCSLINRAAAELLGYPPQEVLGQDTHALFHHSYASGETCPEQECPIYLALQTGQTCHVDDAIFWKRDGSRISVRYSAHPLSEGGVIQGAVVQFSGIAGRKHLEQPADGQAAVLTRTLKLLATQPAMDTFLGQVLLLIDEQLSASSCALWLYDRDAATVVLHMTSSSGQVYTGNQQLDYPDAGKPTPIRGSEPFLQGSPQWLVMEDALHYPALDDRERAWMQDRGIKALLFVPLILGQSSLGMLSVRTKRDSFTPGEIELTQALAQQATLALQLTRLAEQSRQAAVLYERNRMAGDIHDSLAQALTGVVVQLGTAERLLGDQFPKVQGHIARARDLARQGLVDARRSVLALAPQAREYANPHEALGRILEQMTAGTTLRAEFQVHGAPHALPPEIGLTLLRVGQEALTNIVKHARARVARIELSYDARQITLQVRDDGQGFSLRQQAGQDRFGLTSMRDRAARIGADLKIVSRPGKGTKVRVVASLADPAEGRAQ